MFAKSGTFQIPGILATVNIQSQLTKRRKKAHTVY